MAERKLVDERPTLRGKRVVLRPGADDDAEAVTAILKEPAVARWWGRYDLERVRREELLGGFAILVDDALAGWLLFEEESHPDYRFVSFDISLTGGVQGKGYGPEALRAAIRHFAGRGHHRFTIDPAVDNDRAIRAYASVGFRPVGVMRSYERAADGSWHDNLLMDLLVTELEPDPRHR